MRVSDTTGTDRGIKNGTLNTFSCLQSGSGFPNNGVPMVAEEFSGGGTVVWSDHLEGAINATGIGDLFPTAGVLVGNVSPNHGVTNGNACRITADIALSTECWHDADPHAWR
jgi:hypothetical protein